jgi:catechol 2,3-dioxygenase-like lactoylglutathione lyase family enzyme
VSENGSIDPATSMGAVRLNVADLEGVRDFYRDVIGLSVETGTDGSVRLGTLDAIAPNLVGDVLIELVGATDAPPRPPGTSGLFHLAILLPTRADLARSLQRVAEAGWRLSGASDHLVSEALYLSDPEGNGIELYRDRPREEWPVRDGALQMDTLPLDLDGVPSSSRPAGITTISASTPGPARVRLPRPRAAAGCASSRSVFPAPVSSLRGRIACARPASSRSARRKTWCASLTPPATAWCSPAQPERAAVVWPTSIRWPSGSRS